MSHLPLINVVFTLWKKGTLPVSLPTHSLLNMKYFDLEKPITLCCTRAESYPQGVRQAHDTLHEFCPDYTSRTYFAVSYGGKDGITYMPGVTEHFPGELAQFPLEQFTLKKGRYAYIDLDNFMQNLPQLRLIFDELLQHPDLDTGGYCLEWYLNANVCRCLVKLND